MLYLQIALIANNDAHLSAGAGIWCGVFFGISGGLGTLAACKPSSCRFVKQDLSLKAKLEISFLLFQQYLRKSWRLQP